MSTPSKEALEAANELFPDAICFYRFVAENAAEIIDRHFAPLRRRAKQAEARVKELAGALQELKYWEGTEGFEEYLQKAFATLARHASAEPAKHPDTERIRWLHDCSGGTLDAEGYEWGIFRVKWDAQGRPVEVWQTNSDLSDLDAEMARDAARKEVQT